MFSHIEYFCLFIGYPRSGSSLVGSLLDAHPNVAVSHELDVLARIGREQFTRERLFKTICDFSREQAAKGRRQGDYAYCVKGGWQGRIGKLRVIGDKEAGRTAMRCYRDPHSLEVLQGIVNTPIKFIHCVRHPLDNIATLLRKDAAAFKNSPLEYRLQMAAKYYFDVCTKAVARVRASTPPNCWLTMHHEDFLASPKSTLQRLFAFLGQDVTDELLEACAGVVWVEPRRTRDLIEWPPSTLELIRERCDEYDFMAPYRECLLAQRAALA